MGANIFAMPTSSILLLFSFTFGISKALPWTGPRETSVYQPEEFSPRPTDPVVPPSRLFRRASADVRVCGWIGGNKAKIASCNEGSSCIHDTNHGFIGCCPTTGRCTDGVYTTCLDEASSGWDSVKGLINNGILTW